MTKVLIWVLPIVYTISGCAPSGEDGQAIVANQISIGTYTISWLVPVERINGDALLLNEIKGYEVCFRVDDGSETCETFNVDDPSENKYLLSNMKKGLNYITLSLIDTNNIYSNRSEVFVYMIS